MCRHMGISTYLIQAGSKQCSRVIVQEAVGALKDHEEHEADLNTLYDMLRQQRNKSSHLRKARLLAVKMA